MPPSVCPRSACARRLLWLGFAFAQGAHCRRSQQPAKQIDDFAEHALAKMLIARFASIFLGSPGAHALATLYLDIPSSLSWYVVRANLDGITK